MNLGGIHENNAWKISRICEDHELWNHEMGGPLYLSICKVEIFLEQREVAFLSPSKICENLNFSAVHL